MQKMPDLALFKKENIVFNYIKMCDTNRKCYLKMATKLKSGLIKWGGDTRGFAVKVAIFLLIRSFIESGWLTSTLIKWHNVSSPTNSSLMHCKRVI